MRISSTCENINEVGSKISSTKSDLRISKISHSFEVHISEIRERTDFRKTQCLKLQQSCWTWKYDIYELCTRSICMYIRTNRVYIVARTRSWNEVEFDFLYGITEIIQFTEGDRFAWWEAARLKFTRVIKRVVLNQQF